MDEFEKATEGAGAPSQNVIPIASTRPGNSRRRRDSGTAAASGTHQPGETAPAGDPLLALVRDFIAERDRFRATDVESDEELNAEAEQMHRLLDRLEHDTPQCLSEEGAREALLFIAEDMRDHIGDIHQAVLWQVMQYLMRRATFIQ